MTGTKCCVPGCNNNTKCNRNVSWHSFPRDQKLRNKWLARIHRRGSRPYSAWKPKYFDKICGIHFNASGKKTKSDILPRFFLPSVVKIPEDEMNETIVSDNKPMETDNQKPPESETLETGMEESGCLESQSVDHTQTEIIISSIKIEEPDEIYCSSGKSTDGYDEMNETIISDNKPRETDNQKLPESESLETGMEESGCLESQSVDHTQTENNSSTFTEDYGDDNELLETIVNMTKIIKNQEEEIKKLNEKVQAEHKISTQWRVKFVIMEEELKKMQNDLMITNVKGILDNDKMLHFYTGFQNKGQFLSFVNLMEPAYSAAGKCRKNIEGTGRPHVLTMEEEVFIVYSMLRVGLLQQDIAYRFNISVSKVSKIWRFWIHLLSSQLSKISSWPSRATVDKYMPVEFKDSYPGTRVILDSIELNIETPSDFRVHSETYSTYKMHNTAKGFLGITPNGYVSHVTNLYEGRISDRTIVEDCGILDLLDAGDHVMAYRGFTIEDLLKQRNVTLNIQTKNIAALRIHVERVIKEIKSFRIIKFACPSSMHHILNDIWKICCYSVNYLGKPLPERNQNA